MLNCFTTEKHTPIIISPVYQNEFSNWIKNQSNTVKNIVSANNFSAKPNSYCLITDQNGNLEKVLLGVENKNDFLAFGVLPKVLPAGNYHIDAASFSPKQLEHAAIGWGMGSYQFTHYKKLKEFGAKLLCDENYNINKIESIVSSIFWVRDLINMPASDLYPEKMAEISKNLAEEFKAEFKKIDGEELRKNFPAVYAVGNGSEKKPVLIDLRFGDESAPKVVLIGKGVCFDSGGLQLKPSSGMFSIESMKKDMGGAAHALGLARMIMAAKLPINLRMIIPAVENLPSGDSLKPGDVIATRKGMSVEISNTDAEGRLILADSLTLACEWKPELIVDFATLTGAARIALGPDVVALFTPDDQLAQDISAAMTEEHEPVWRMPLYQPYLEYLDSSIADIKNAAVGKTAGAITAALMLQQFVSSDIKWVHFDMHANNENSTPGRPEGGEAGCLKGLFRYLEKNFCNKQ